MKPTILIAAFCLLTSCTTQEVPASEIEKNTEIVKGYFDGLRTGEVDRIPLAKGVVFEGPLLPESKVGETEVRQFLGAISRSFVSAKLELSEIVLEKSNSCLIFTVTFEADSLVIPVIDHLRIEDDSITYIRPYFDPRGYLDLANDSD